MLEVRFFDCERGVAILQDAAILAWELVNEARYANPEDAHPQATDAPMPTGDQLDTWTGDVASYLKTVDPNHLIIDGRYVQAFSVEVLEQVYFSHQYSLDDKAASIVHPVSGGVSYPYALSAHDEIIFRIHMAIKSHDSPMFPA